MGFVALVAAAFAGLVGRGEHGIRVWQVAAPCGLLGVYVAVVVLGVLRTA